MAKYRNYFAVLIGGIAAVMLSACSSDNSNPANSEITPPRVIATSPASGATHISTTTTVTVTFSEPVDPTSVAILIDGLFRGPISVKDSIATLTLDSRLFQKIEYEAAVLAGVKDFTGNRMDSTYLWSFTTGFGPLGETWTSRFSPTTHRLNAVVRGSYEFLAVGAAGTMVLSEDGLAWTVSTFQPDAEQLWSALPIGDRFIVAGSPGTILASTSPYVWTQDNLGDSIAELYDLWVSLDGIYMAGTGGETGTEGIIVKYAAPTDWTSVSLGPGLTPRSITQFGDEYVVVGDNGLVMTSDDGMVWNDHSLGPDWGSLTTVRWSAHSGKLIAVGSAIMSSSDGVTWLQHTPISTTLLRDIGWTTLTVDGTTHALYCAVGDEGRIFTSEDAIQWTPQNSGVSVDLYGIARGLVPTRFVAVGEGGIILTSE